MNNKESVKFLTEVAEEIKNMSKEDFMKRWKESECDKLFLKEYKDEYFYIEIPKSYCKYCNSYNWEKINEKY